MKFILAAVLLLASGNVMATKPITSDFGLLVTTASITSLSPNQCVQTDAGKNLISSGGACGGGAASQWTSTKSSSVFFSTGTALLNIPNLSFTLAANTTYQYDFYILFQTTTTTTGARFAMDFPGTPLRIAYSVEIPLAADGVDGAIVGWGTADNDLVIGTGVQTINVSFMAHIKGVVVTGAAGGSMAPQIACELAGTPVARSMPGSFGRLWTEL